MISGFSVGHSWLVDVCCCFWLLCIGIVRHQYIQDRTLSSWFFWQSSSWASGPGYFRFWRNRFISSGFSLARVWESWFQTCFSYAFSIFFLTLCSHAKIGLKISNSFALFWSICKTSFVSLFMLPTCVMLEFSSKYCNAFHITTPRRDYSDIRTEFTIYKSNS